MLWSILIATLESRTPRLQKLLDSLLPQAEQFPGIEVVAYRNHMERPLADIRQALVEDAQGTYVNFVDDDDELPGYYCEKIFALLDGKVDYIGWRMQCIQDGIKLKPTYHSLRWGGWYDDSSGFYRDISHLNPVRRVLALKADFRKGSGPEDHRWADQMSLHLKTELYISDVMYTYHANSEDSTWRTARPGRDNVRMPRPRIQSKRFRWHPESTDL